MTSDDQFERLASEHQETAAVILEGKFPMAARLLRSARMEYHLYEHDNWNGGTDVYDVQLTVDARRLSDYPEDVVELIKDAIEKVLASFRNVWIHGILVVPELAKRRVANQAISWNEDENLLERNGMQFRSQEEVTMFELLKEKQKELPTKTDTILIVPLPSTWDGERRKEPDFIVTYRGRAGIIEVDDPFHHGRRVADQTREQIFEQCGVEVPKGNRTNGLSELRPCRSGHMSGSADPVSG